MHKYPYKWNLKDLKNVGKNRYKVFSCFAGGGGSSMGYKLAGFDVIGCNEIDPKMIECYKENLKPKYSYLEPIQDFVTRNDLPDELYNLDILDGSPPCSSFSIAGNREEDWGKEKKFREGQVEQILDTLFFDFIDLADKLKPKIVIAENVKGLLLGEAQKYVRNILNAFDCAGYYVDFKLLDASKMGVPQRRERVFFYAIRKDFYEGTFADMFGTRPNLNLSFNENEIPYIKIRQKTGNKDAIGLSKMIKKYWLLSEAGKSFAEVHPKGSYFNEIKLHPDKVIPTIRASGLPYDYEIERTLFINEIIQAFTFPLDYNFTNNDCNYICGMSVPPVMMAQVASRIKEYWLNDIV